MKTSIAFFAGFLVGVSLVLSGQIQAKWRGLDPTLEDAFEEIDKLELQLKLHSSELDLLRTRVDNIEYK